MFVKPTTQGYGIIAIFLLSNNNNNNNNNNKIVLVMTCAFYGSLYLLSKTTIPNFTRYVQQIFSFSVIKVSIIDIF